MNNNGRLSLASRYKQSERY